jgi:hypothetical protein
VITKPTENRFVNTIIFWRRDQRRFWELGVCNTAAASRNIFDHGCSMWQGWSFHPNCPDAKEFDRHLSRYWDHSAGLRCWHEQYNPREAHPGSSAGGGTLYSESAIQIFVSVRQREKAATLE